jgi:NAD+ synthase (glutamine-hydrolysing)
MRLGLAQFNTTVGDLRGNVQKMISVQGLAREKAVDLLVFPELCVCGYPPEDLLHKPRFLADTQAALDDFAGHVQSETVIAGFVQSQDCACYNAAALIREGAVRNVYRKIILPNYGVFDEKRYFHPGLVPLVFEHDGIRIALTICEDVWDLSRLDAVLDGRRQNLDLIINISASPFHIGKIRQRQETLARCAAYFNCAVAYCNLVGGQDELVFDGRSMAVDASGRVIAQAAEFADDLCVIDITKHEDGALSFTPATPYQPAAVNEVQEVWQALLLGTGDYVRKNGFTKTVIGLSGGIDSSLVAAAAVSALGPENVIGITMPSRFNTAETRSDAQRLAENLAIAFHTVPISEPLEAFSQTLGLVDGWDEKGLAYENLQARVRGAILMSYSNQFGWLVLTTGNKSETAVGYSTLYGDSAGGFAVIKDVPKTLVYRLCRYLNEQAGRDVIPESVITRIPSAELRENQKDSDSLPEYDVLDEILRLYVELEKSAAEIVQAGFDEAQVKRVIRLVDRSEYKRRQSPPGVKITPRAFGRDRRMPITNRYYP